MKELDRAVSFDYSTSQWKKIEEAVRAVRTDPISGQERKYLCKAADEFRFGGAERISGKYLPPKQQVKLWTRVAKLCGELREAIEIAGRNKEGRFWRDSPLLHRAEFWSERDCENRQPLPDSPRDLHGMLNYSDIVDLLADVEKVFRQCGNPMHMSVSRFKSFTGRLDPPVVFQQRILRLWTAQFGGTLTITRDPSSISNPISGALVKYFFAVATPVMGADLPSVQSLPDIIERQKVFAEWERTWQKGEKSALESTYVWESSTDPSVG
jgi:hypothetical protein